MSLEAVAPKLHADSLGHWSLGVDLEMTTSLGSFLNDQQSYLGRALLSPHGERLRKKGLKKACLLHAQFINCGRSTSFSRG